MKFKNMQLNGKLTNFYKLRDMKILIKNLKNQQKYFLVQENKLVTKLNIVFLIFIVEIERNGCIWDNSFLKI